MEIDPARRLQAAYDGWHIVELQEAIAGGRGGHGYRRQKVVNSWAPINAKMECLSSTWVTWRKRLIASTCASSAEEVMPYINAYRMGRKIDLSDGERFTAPTLTAGLAIA